MSTPNISHATSGTIFFISLASAISAISAALRISVWLAALRISVWPAAPKRWRKGCRNRKETTGLWQSQSRRRWTWPPLPRPILRLWTVLLRRKARWYSKYFVEHLTQEIAITTQRRVLKDYKKMHFWTWVQGNLSRQKKTRNIWIATRYPGYPGTPGNPEDSETEGNDEDWPHNLHISSN